MPRLDKARIDELKAALDSEQRAIAFEEATEPPGSSPLNDEKRAGSFNCAVCGEALFSSDAKYESGSGWPSFFAPLDEAATETKRDFKLLLPRTEFHCANCGAHLGHVFKDGPPPTGERWCANGAVLDFRPESGED